jgi:hypothetical protein
MLYGWASLTRRDNAFDAASSFFAFAGDAILQAENPVRELIRLIKFACAHSVSNWRHYASDETFTRSAKRCKMRAGIGRDAPSICPHLLETPDPRC